MKWKNALNKLEHPIWFAVRICKRQAGVRMVRCIGWLLKTSGLGGLRIATEWEAMAGKKEINGRTGYLEGKKCGSARGLKRVGE